MVIDQRGRAGPTTALLPRTSSYAVATLSDPLALGLRQRLLAAFRGRPAP